MTLDELALRPVLCKYCGDKFEVITTSNKQFCNFQCYWDWMKTQTKENSAVVRNQAKLLEKTPKHPCVVCGKIKLFICQEEQSESIREGFLVYGERFRY